MGGRCGRSTRRNRSGTPVAKPARYYEEEVQALDPGLVRAVLSVLRFHAGKANAISKPNLLADLRRLGFTGGLTYATAERQVRAAIQELRKAGHLVCSSSGDGGYYLAADWAEYEEFAQVEYRSKIIDMSETLRAMDAAAAEKLGRRPNPKGQEALF